MQYPCYPIAKKPTLHIGGRAIKLPKSTWAVRSGNRAISCSYHLDANNDRVVVRLMTEAHCSVPIEVFFYRDHYGAEWKVKELAKKPSLPLSLAWSSGGINDGFTASEVADVMASLWAVAADITGIMRREILVFTDAQTSATVKIAP
jgi:hypothetical protein